MTDYGPQDTSTTSLGANQFPISEVWTPNSGFSAVEGGTQSTDSGGKKSAPVNTAVKDGSNATEGATTDAAVTGDTSGTLSAKLRGLTKIFTDIWDSVNHRIKVDASGATVPVSGTFWQATQPVSGTVTANAGTNLNTSALALESGGHLANIDTHTPVQGQATMANSSPVVIASNQSDLPVKGDFTEQSGLSAGALNADLVVSTDVSGYAWISLHITAIASGGTITFQASNDNFATQVESVNLARVSSSTTISSAVSTTGIFEGPVNFRYFRARQTAWTSGSTTGVLELYTVSKALNTVPSAASQAGTWTMQPGNTANTTPWLVNLPTSATGTLTSVAAAVANTQLLASNASRKGMYVFNDSSAIMYLAFNATASTTSYTVQVPANGFFEMPTSPIYTGQINAVWSAAVGNARITEMS